MRRSHLIRTERVCPFWFQHALMGTASVPSVGYSWLQLAGPWPCLVVSVRRQIKALGVCGPGRGAAARGHGVSAALCLISFLRSRVMWWCLVLSITCTRAGRHAHTHTHIRVIGPALLFSWSLWPMFRTKGDQVYVSPHTLVRPQHVSALCLFSRGFGRESW